MAGFVVTLTAVLLLWLPQSSREYFFGWHRVGRLSAAVALRGYLPD